MTNVLFMDGFDAYDFNNTNSGRPSISDKYVVANGPRGTTGRYSGQALYMSNDISGPNIWGYWPSYVTSCTLGYAFQTTSVINNSGSQKIMLTHDGNDQIGVGISNMGHINLWRGGTLLAQSPINIIKTRLWHYIEIELFSNTSAGTCNVWLDGVKVINFAGNTQNQTVYGINGIHLGNDSGNGEYFLDDMYIIDQSTRLGERRIETLYPNGDTTQKDFTPSSGTDNFAMLNSTLVEGTNYVSSTTPGASDIYNMTDLTSTPTTIDAVQLSVWAQKTDSQTRSIETILKSGTAMTYSPESYLPSTPTNIWKIDQVDPQDGAAWNKTKVNAVQGGFKIIK